MLAIDHVLFAVDDLAVAASDVEARFGLASIEGGRHPAWGTANRIVPLGSTYLELVAVVDPVVAPATAFGRWVATGSRGRALGWAVRTESIDAVAARLDLEVTEGSREAPDGKLLRWRGAGVAEAAAEPPLPFFIEWVGGSPFPGATQVTHPGGAAELRRLEVSGHPARLSAWLGDHPLPIAVRSGPPRIERVVLGRGSRGMVLEW